MGGGGGAGTSEVPVLSPGTGPPGPVLPDAPGHCCWQLASTLQRSKLGALTAGWVDGVVGGEGRGRGLGSHSCPGTSPAAAGGRRQLGAGGCFLQGCRRT